MNIRRRPLPKTAAPGGSERVNDATTALAVLSIEHARCTGRRIAPSCMMSWRSLVRLSDLGLVELDTAPTYIAHVETYRHGTRPCRIVSPSDWSRLCQHIIDQLGTQRPPTPPSSLACMWRELAEAHVYDYASGCARAAAQPETLADVAMQVLRRTPDALSIDQWRHACAMAMPPRCDDVAAQSDFAERLERATLRILSDDRLQHPCAAPQHPPSAMELVFNTWFVPLGDAYYTTPAGVDGLQRVSRHHGMGARLTRQPLWKA